MKELFFIKDTPANKISYFHLLLLMASLPFDRFYSHVILISLIIHTLIQFNRQAERPASKLRIILLQSVFLVTLFSTIYTINLNEAYKLWGMQITILVFPLLFYFTSFPLSRYRNPLLLAFSLVCMATIAYLYLNALFTIRHYDLPVLSVLSSAFTNHNFSAPVNMHATYLSLQTGIALIYMITVLVKETSCYCRILYLVCICLLTSGLIQLCSKSVLFCLFIIVNLAVPLFLLQGARRRKYMFITVFLSVIAAACIFRQDAYRERYITDLQLDLSTSAAVETTDPRLARWKAAGELIARSPVIGYGAGAETGILQEIYFQKKLYSSYLHTLNIHNQYLSFLLRSGVIGLFVYLVTLAAGFQLSLIKNDLVFFTFLLLITFVSISENLLNVEKGIIFYSFFFSFFMFSYESENKPDQPSGIFI